LNGCNLVKDKVSGEEKLDGSSDMLAFKYNKKNAKHDRFISK